MSENNEDKLKVENFRQRPGYCGPAALKIALSYFKKSYTEDQLAMLCGTTLEDVAKKGEFGVGTEHEGLVEAAKELGGFVFVKESGTLDELKYFVKEEKLPVIIGWFDKDEDHYSVVVNVTDKNVILVDSGEHGPERWLDKEDFPNIWFDFVGKDDKIVSWGWYMVVTFEKKKFNIKGGHYY